MRQVVELFEVMRRADGQDILDMSMLAALIGLVALGAASASGLQVSVLVENVAAQF